MQPEARLRSRCRMLCQTHVLPPCWWSAIEHGRQHHGTDQQRAAEWGRLKAQGVHEGIADMVFMIRGYTLWVELKVGTDQTEAQQRFEAAQSAIGNGYVVVRTVTDFGVALERAGIPIAAGWRVKAQIHDLALGVDAAAPKAKRVGKTTGKTFRKPSLRQVARGNRVALAMVRGGA